MKHNRLIEVDDDTTTALIKRAQAGDQNAWGRLVETHRQDVFRLAYLILHDAHEAEDAAQEALIRAYTHLDSFECDRPFRPWLLRVAANTARNRRRAAGRYWGMINRLWSRPAVETGRVEPVAEKLDQRRRAEELRQAVGRLRPPAREVIYLRFFLDLNEADTAEVLDVPRGTVKSRTHRALAQLRGVIQQEYPHLEEDFGRFG